MSTVFFKLANWSKLNEDNSLKTSNANMRKRFGRAARAIMINFDKGGRRRQRVRGQLAAHIAHLLQALISSLINRPTPLFKYVLLDFT